MQTARLKDALSRGDLETVNGILGRFYSLTGIVIEGNKLGRTIGFPTANIAFPEADPPDLAHGVYAVFATVQGQKIPGIANIGIRPTLNLHRLSVEVYLFDFSGDLYGQQMTISFVERVREERKFPDLKALQDQIVKDVVLVKSILSDRHHPDPRA